MSRILEPANFLLPVVIIVRVRHKVSVIDLCANANGERVPQRKGEKFTQFAHTALVLDYGRPCVIVFYYSIDVLVVMCGLLPAFAIRLSFTFKKFTSSRSKDLSPVELLALNVRYCVNNIIIDFTVFIGKHISLHQHTIDVEENCSKHTIH